tara:strand:+ start:62 stop:1006 length:945 start_codon:yes stop_codon:yes gene_type:complete
MRKIIVTTPVSHLPGAIELLNTKGDITLAETINKKELKKILLKKDLDTIICNPNQQTYKIDKELLEGTNIKTINTCSTGLNHIDVNYCNSVNIEIQHHKNDLKLLNQLPSTSELAFGLMLSLLRRIPQSQNHVSEYKWDYTKFVGRQVKDLTIGIIGYGRLGKMMYNFCRAFGANVIVYDPYKINKEMPFEYLITHCDVISLHVHVTDETKYMINKNSLGLGTTSSFGSVKGDCYIINTSRGEIVNETDIVEGLKSGKITGYATDVVEDEFGDLTKSPIIKAMNEGENIIVTPHVGGMTIEGQTKAYEWSFNKL